MGTLWPVALYNSAVTHCRQNTHHGAVALLSSIFSAVRVGRSVSCRILGQLGACIFLPTDLYTFNGIVGCPRLACFAQSVRRELRCTLSVCRYSGVILLSRDVGSWWDIGCVRTVIFLSVVLGVCICPNPLPCMLSLSASFPSSISWCSPFNVLR